MTHSHPKRYNKISSSSSQSSSSPPPTDSTKQRPAEATAAAAAISINTNEASGASQPTPLPPVPTSPESIPALDVKTSSLESLQVQPEGLRHPPTAAAGLRRTDAFVGDAAIEEERRKTASRRDEINQQLTKKKKLHFVQRCQALSYVQLIMSLDVETCGIILEQELIPLRARLAYFLLICHLVVVHLRWAKASVPSTVRTSTSEQTSATSILSKVTSGIEVKARKHERSWRIAESKDDFSADAGELSKSGTRSGEPIPLEPIVTDEDALIVESEKLLERGEALSSEGTPRHPQHQHQHRGSKSGRLMDFAKPPKETNIMAYVLSLNDWGQKFPRRILNMLGLKGISGVSDVANSMVDIAEMLSDPDIVDALQEISWDLRPSHELLLTLPAPTATPNPSEIQTINNIVAEGRNLSTEVDEKFASLLRSKKFHLTTHQMLTVRYFLPIMLNPQPAKTQFMAFLTRWNETINETILGGQSPTNDSGNSASTPVDGADLLTPGCTINNRIHSSYMQLWTTSQFFQYLYTKEMCHDKTRSTHGNFMLTDQNRKQVLPLRREFLACLITLLTVMSLMSSGRLTARLMSLLVELCNALDISEDKCRMITALAAEQLQLHVLSQSTDEAETITSMIPRGVQQLTERSFWNKVQREVTTDPNRYLKIAGMAIGIGSLSAITAGLAAPAFAAGIAALGIASTSGITAFLGTTIGSATLASLFGASGAGLTSWKYSRRYGNVKDFAFHHVQAFLSSRELTSREKRHAKQVEQWASKASPVHPTKVTSNEGELETPEQMKIVNRPRQGDDDFHAEQESSLSRRTPPSSLSPDRRGLDRKRSLSDSEKGPSTLRTHGPNGSTRMRVRKLDGQEGRVGGGGAFPPAVTRRKSFDKMKSGAAAVSAEERSIGLTICVSGWINSKQDLVKPWKPVADIFGADVYAVQWEPELLADLGNMLLRMVGENVASSAATLWIQMTMTATTGFVMWPVSILQYAGQLDNTWIMCKSKAHLAGKVLAEVLGQVEVTGSRPITLLGYSMGARVISYCLRYLHDSKKFDLVQHAILMGLPEPKNRNNWLKMRQVVSGRLVNCYSKQDWLLALGQRYFEQTWYSAGLSAVDIVEGIENYDVSEIVGQHFNYKSKIRDILAHINFTTCV